MQFARIQWDCPVPFVPRVFPERIHYAEWKLDAATTPTWTRCLGIQMAGTWLRRETPPSPHGCWLYVGIAWKMRGSPSNSRSPAIHQWKRRTNPRHAEAHSHFRQQELRTELSWRTFSTRKGYEGYLKKWVIPRWGTRALASIKAGEIELWMRFLPMARSSCAKIRNVMSVLYNHTIRHGIRSVNPVRLVRQSAKRKTIPLVLTPDEIQRLIAALPPKESTLVFLDAGTGLRMSELFGLK